MRLLGLRCFFFGFSLSCFSGGEHVFAQTRSSSSTSLVDLEAQANAAYSQKQYGESVRLYRQAVALATDGQRASDEYNEACSLALNGENEHAVDVLTQAVEDGWGDRDHTAGDSDLVSLHGGARFTALLARMESLNKAQETRWGTAAFKTAYSVNLSDADKVAGLSELWAEAKFGFANFWHVPQLDWDAAYRSYLPEVLATKSTADYYKVLRRFYVLLQDGHTGVFEPDELRQYWMPVTTRLIDGRVLVTGSLDPTFDMQGVKPGDEVLQVNGLPVKDYADENVRPYMTASSPQDLEDRTYGMFLFEGSAGTVFHLLIGTTEGKQTRHDFIVPSMVPSTFFSPAEAFAFRTLPGGVAYVALNEFSDNKDDEEWDKHWPELSKARAIILDLRRNGGGSTEIGTHILATLIDKPVMLQRQESPEWVATYRAQGQTEPTLRFPAGSLSPDPAHHFEGKVVMLTGPRTFSAAEDLVVLFATSKRGLIVGEATGGSTGQPLIFNLPGGGLARICTKHDSFPDGKEFVGAGVSPDISAHVTRQDLSRGTDSVLNAGLKAALQP